MQIIIPMAGMGERFLAAGYTQPKPLIEVGGKTMIEHVVRLFPGEENFLFICNNQHLASSNLREVLTKLKPSAKIVGLDYEKLGPVWGTLQAVDLIVDNEPAIVTYCDFDMDWNYEDFKKEMQKQNADGAVLSYTGFHPHLFGPNNY